MTAPAVTVVVPVLDERHALDRSLGAVVAACGQLGAPCEVLVVDGGSTDGSRDVAAAWAARHPYVRVVDNPRRTTPHAFNIGIRAAAAPRIAIVSGHSLVAPDFLRAAVARLDAGVAEIVGGPIVTAAGRAGRLAWLLAQVVSHPFGVGNSRFRVARASSYVDAVPFAVFERRVFEQVGLFSPELPRNQDTEFFGRVAAAGLRVLLSVDVRSTYLARATFGGLLRQGFRNAYWNVLVWRRTPHAFRWRHAIPGLFTASVVGLALLAVVSPAARALLAVEAVVYLAAAMAAALHIAARTRRVLACALPPIFFLYHLTYGAGTLAGVRWLVRAARPDPVPSLDPDPSS